MASDYIRGTTREVHKFLEYLSNCGVQSCEAITISKVMDFIRDQYSHFAVSTLKSTVGKLRTFLKFLYLNELTDHDLACRAIRPCQIEAASMKAKGQK